MFVHHHTGDWHRPAPWATAQRYPSDQYVHKYARLDEIDNEWVRSTFLYMLEEGLTVTQCGADVFQIRKENE